MNGPGQPRIHDVDDPDRWLDVARDPDTPQGDLTWLAAISDDLPIMRAVADHPNAADGTVDVLTRRILTDLAADSDEGDEGVPHWIATISSPRLLAVLADLLKPRFLARLASHPMAPADLLERLADSDLAIVRRGVAANVCASPEVLNRLAGDDETPLVRMAVAGNPATAPDARSRLANDPDSLVRASVARSTRTTSDVLEALAGDCEAAVRLDVASNPAATPRALTRLAEDRQRDVVVEVGRNPATPVEVLRRLAADERLSVRMSVTHNPATPVELLREMTGDSEPEVWQRAEEHLLERRGGFQACSECLAGR